MAPAERGVGGRRGGLRAARPAGLLLALSAFVLLGMADAGLGVSWPSLRAFLDRDLSDLGALLAALSAGYLAASVGYGRLHARMGTGVVLTAGASLLMVSALGLATTGGWATAVVSVGVMGLGAGLVDVGINAHAALEFDRGSINLLHAAYGIGATLGPMVITAGLAARTGWRGGYAAIALLQLSVAVSIWMGRSHWTGADVATGVERLVTVSRIRAAAMLAVFWAYTGVEVAAGQWAFTLLTDGRAMETAPAGAWVAAYWGGLTAGRLYFGAVGIRLTPSRILDGSLALAVAGLAILWWDPLGWGMVGLPVAGLGFAAVFPTMVSLTPSRMGRARSTRMMGYQLAAANIGAATLPWGLGLIAAAAGLESLGAGLFVATASLAGLHLWTDRR